MAIEARFPKMMRCIAAHSEECMKGYSHIHSLCDGLLMEILLRLPNCKSVIQCKCVCKRWDALASHPCFLREFISLKLGDAVHGINNGGNDLNEEHQTFAFVMRYVPDRVFFQALDKRESSFKPSIFHAQNSSFSALHCLEDDKASAATLLVASCKDLLLYCRHEEEKYRDYYISNVQTRKWVMLPSPPSYYGMGLVDGLICDPFYSCDREIVINAAYHYSVVVVHSKIDPSTKLNAHVFSSHCNSQWCDKVLSLTKAWRLLCPGPTLGFSFCFDGKLHFSCIEGIFGFDHKSIGYDDEIQCHLVEWPEGMLLGFHRVGVSQGNLHVSEYVCDKDEFNVWLLKDYKAGEWIFQHKVEIREWVSRDSWVTKTLKKFSRHQSRYYCQRLVYVLGFHPGSCDVIYLLVPGCIFLCNLSTKTAELACRIPVVVYKSRKHYLVQAYSFLAMLQRWPTPLPQFAHDLKASGSGLQE